MTLKNRVVRLERRHPQRELPPLIIRADISREEALQIEYDWIKEHGEPSPLIVILKSPDVSTLGGNSD